ncbi:MAG: bifunctional folylpolyglutamate synthase/dihydrofolate synthase [Bacteroidetes bacterium]|nr:bifunctional folylpolyglutamate synthase/dihydrofolate synthase [Bacteroidota bacterium]
MTYKEAVDYLLNQLPMFQRIGAAAYRADLGNITALSEILGHPERGTRFIHVAGTNGKGSVTHIIASILQAQGYKVGVFTSPHYRDYRERIKINGQLVTRPFITRFVNDNLEKFKAVNASFFEITTAMAFAYFQEKKVDYAIIEVGMGGRLDSTNIITPLLSVITNISFDHTQFLGNTLPLIAGEKAGIIKPHVPVVIGETHPETKDVFISTADKNNAPITFADKKIRLSDFKTEATGSVFSVGGKTYKSDLTGDYQKKNIATGLAAIQQLQAAGVKITDNAIAKGLKQVKTSTYFIGRWMVMSKKPLVIFDSAHNEGGIKELAAQLRKLSYDQLHFVYGTVSDKDITHILSLLPKKAAYYFCKPDIPRGKDAMGLQQEAAAQKLKGAIYTSVKQAYKAALAKAGKNDLVVVSGSIFVVAELV